MHSGLVVLDLGRKIGAIGFCPPRTEHSVTSER